MVGLNQIDLVTAITRILENYSDGDANLLRKNILLLGGGSQIVGL